MLLAFVILVLLAFSVAVGIAIMGLANLGIGALFGVSFLVFVVMGGAFLVAIWFGSFMAGRPPLRKRTETAKLHELKLLRHEKGALEKQVKAQERRILQLEGELNRRRTQEITRATPPPPTVGNGDTGRLRHIETRELKPDTGEYRPVNTPTYTVRDSGTYPAVRDSADTGYRPARRTGAHPAAGTGRFPRVRTDADA
jgi:membrane protein implicated in regulation of membrane protease activity